MAKWPPIKTRNLLVVPNTKICQTSDKLIAKKKEKCTNQGASLKKPRIADNALSAMRAYLNIITIR